MTQNADQIQSKRSLASIHSSFPDGDGVYWSGHMGAPETEGSGNSANHFAVVHCRRL